MNMKMNIHETLLDAGLDPALFGACELETIAEYAGFLEAGGELPGFLCPCLSLPELPESAPLLTCIRMGAQRVLDAIDETALFHAFSCSSAEETPVADAYLDLSAAYSEWENAFAVWLKDCERVVSEIQHILKNAAEGARLLACRQAAALVCGCDGIAECEGQALISLEAGLEACSLDSAQRQMRVSDVCALFACELADFFVAGEPLLQTQNIPLSPLRTAALRLRKACSALLNEER